MAGQQPAFAGPQHWTQPQPREATGVAVRNVKPAVKAATTTALPAKPARVTWPAAGEATVDLATASAAAGTSPIRLGSAIVGDEGARTTKALTPGPLQVKVSVYDQAASSRAHVQGMLFKLGRAAGNAPTAATVAVPVHVDYSAFADAYGGDWASRLQLVQLPQCALNTPSAPECQKATPLATQNDTGTSTLTAQVMLTAQGNLLAAQAGAAGDNGDYSATGLTAAGTWQVSTQNGDFSWSYPMRMPPAPGGPAPTFSLGYSSGSVDGRTGTSNNQGGWVGDGWDAWPGFIERKYASCGDDNPSHKTGDQCWFNDNASLSLSGHAGELIQDGSVWRLKKDDGTRVERVSGDGGRANGDNDNEYWKVTTQDGTRYYFGYHRLPGWTSGQTETNSTWTLPVYGNNSGEPCYNATFANAYCNQAWRWNLDYVVDPNGNSMAYYYGKETAGYGRDDNVNQRTDYVRGGWLDHIDYGMRTGAEYSGAAPLRATFGTAERCLASCWAGTAWQSKPTAANWKDTPWDLDCTANPCTGSQLSPAFFTARRLTTVTTQVRSGTAYTDVERWTLRQEFINAGNNEGTPMWLRGITHTGLVTSAGGAAVTDPEVTFDTGAEALPNRVDGPSDGRTALNRWRIKSINNESGGQILVSYSPTTDCSRSSPPVPQTNTTRCMPSYYAPSNTGLPTLDWFHKYVVTRVDLDDLVTDEPTQTFYYDYLDTPAWHYNDDELTVDKYRTWGQWRGYGRVRVRQGEASGQQTAIEHIFMRGMNGDHLPTGTRSVSVSDTWGGSVADDDAFAGFEREQITYNGPGGAEVTSTVNDPWKSGPTAARTRNGVTTQAWHTDKSATRTRTATAAGGFRITRTAATFDADGLTLTAENSGDEAVSGDETCTRNTYARNSTLWIVSKTSSETLKGTCAAATNPAQPGSVLRRTRLFYDSYVDDSSFGAAPTRGNVVRSEELDSWTGSTPNYVAVMTSAYDAIGRVTTSTDARGYATTTQYNADSAGLVTSTVVTNPKSQTTTTLKEPAWNLPTKITDANGAVTEQTYDGLGHLTAVWLPGRARTQTPSVRMTYLLRSSGGPSVTTTEKLLPTGAGYAKTAALYDGFLHQRQTQSQASGGGRVLTDTVYNTLGQTGWSSQAYYDTTNTAVGTDLGVPQGQIPATVQHVYDGAGREIATVSLAAGVERSRVTSATFADRIDRVPPAGATATSTIVDGLGHTVALRQYKNRADVGSTDPAKFDETKYEYDLTGALTKTTDPAGNIWSGKYDLRGRKIEATDPDQGTAKSKFDNDGNVVENTDQLGNVLAYTYDELGRKTVERSGSATGPKLAEWTYDTLTNGVGRLTKSVRYNGAATYESRVDAYDVAGQPTSTSIVLPSTEGSLCAATAPNTCTYTTSYAYKANRAIASTTVPAAADLPSEKVAAGYNDIGLQTTLLSASQIYVYAATYDKLGRLTQRTLGAYGSRVAMTEAYDEYTGWQTGLNVVPELKPEAANYTYSYDLVGQVTKVSDTPSGGTADHQCYTYDSLGRMTEAWTPNLGDCAAARTTGSLGGPAPYWTSWEFDLTGNRTKEISHATAGNTTAAYTYPAAGAAQPHTVTQVNASGAASWTRSYTYDGEGRTKTRPGSGANQQTLAWNEEGRLKSVTEAGGATSYVYDADGNVLVRKGPAGNTLFLPGGTEITTSAAGGTAKATRYYSHKDVVIAVRTAAGLDWIVGDLRGTATVTVNAATLVASKRLTTPYGQDRGTAAAGWPSSLQRGFVGGSLEPSGLTRVGVRQYDPQLGRFISDDPVIDENDPQQLNGYAYANNSPISSADRTGFRTDDQYYPPGPKNDSNPGPSANDSDDPFGWNRSPKPVKHVPGKMPTDLMPEHCRNGSDNHSGCDGPLQWSWSVVEYSNEAGIDPRLLLSVLQIEVGKSDDLGPIDTMFQLWQWQADNVGEYRPLKRAFGKGGSGPSLGWGNMQEDSWDQTVKNHPKEFEGHNWSDMIGDKGLAMKATAFRLRDLMDFVKEKTPAEMRKSHSPEQLAAATYNIGTQNMEDSFKRGSLGPLGTSYGNSAMSYYYGSSDKIICHSGLYTC